MKIYTHFISTHRHPPRAQPPHRVQIQRGVRLPGNGVIERRRVVVVAMETAAGMVGGRGVRGERWKHRSRRRGRGRRRLLYPLLLPQHLLPKEPGAYGVAGGSLHTRRFPARRQIVVIVF